MTTAASTQVQLVARPRGWPSPDDFRLVRVELPEPAAGEARVRGADLREAVVRIPPAE